MFDDTTRAIPNARLVAIPAGRHHVPMTYPAEAALVMLEFVKANLVGYEPRENTEDRRGVDPKRWAPAANLARRSGSSSETRA